ARTGDFSGPVPRAPPRLPSWLADFLVTGGSMENGKSVRELGMTYRPIRESIRDSIGWFRDEGLFEGPEAPAARQLEVRAPVENPPVGLETTIEPQATETSTTGAAQIRRQQPRECPA